MGGGQSAARPLLPRKAPVRHVDEGHDCGVEGQRELVGTQVDHVVHAHVHGELVAHRHGLHHGVHSHLRWRRWWSRGRRGRARRGHGGGRGDSWGEGLRWGHARREGGRRRGRKNGRRRWRRGHLTVTEPSMT